MKNISAEELYSRIDACEKIYLIDVREPYEHEEFSIGGTLLPLGNIRNLQIDEIEDLKNDELILYCRSGNRSMQACLMLETMGFKNTTNLIGGMLAWQEKFGR